MALTTYVEGYARLLAIGQEVLHVERQQAVLEDAAGNHRVLVLVQHRKVAVFRRLHRVGQLQLGEQLLQLVAQDFGHLEARLLIRRLVLVQREIKQYRLGRHRA